MYLVLRANSVHYIVHYIDLILLTTHHSNMYIYIYISSTYMPNVDIPEYNEII